MSAITFTTKPQTQTLAIQKVLSIRELRFNILEYVFTSTSKNNINNRVALVCHAFNNDFKKCGNHLVIESNIRESEVEFNKFVKFANNLERLQFLDLSNSDVTEQRLSAVHAPKLEGLRLKRCHYLTSLTINETNYPRLQVLTLSGKNITTCTLANLPKLRIVSFSEIDCQTPELANLNLTNLPKLDRIIALNSKITVGRLSFAEVPALQTIGTSESEVEQIILNQGFDNDQGFDSCIEEITYGVMLSKIEVGSNDKRSICVTHLDHFYKEKDPIGEKCFARDFRDC